MSVRFDYGGSLGNEFSPAWVAYIKGMDLTLEYSDKRMADLNEILAALGPPLASPPDVHQVPLLNSSLIWSHSNGYTSSTWPANGDIIPSTAPTSRQTPSPVSGGVFVVGHPLGVVFGVALSILCERHAPRRQAQRDEPVGDYEGVDPAFPRHSAVSLSSGGGFTNGPIRDFSSSCRSGALGTRSPHR